MNLTEMEKKTSKEKLLDYITSNRYKFRWFDQDVLNVLYGDSAVYVDADVYNNQMHMHINNMLENALIIHYTSYMKPWKLYYAGYGDKYFWKYAKKAGFRGRYFLYKIFHGSTLMVYKKYKQLRYRV